MGRNSAHRVAAIFSTSVLSGNNASRHPSPKSEKPVRPEGRQLRGATGRCCVHGPVNRPFTLTFLPFIASALAEDTVNALCL